MDVVINMWSDFDCVVFIGCGLWMENGVVLGWVLGLPFIHSPSIHHSHFHFFTSRAKSKFK